MVRETVIDRFLNGVGLRPERAVLAEDASFRRYWRLPAGLVLMDAPPEVEDVRPFLALQAHLAGGGLSVPAVREAAPDLGLVLLEDFGDDLFPRVMEAGNIVPLYDAAVAALVHLHRLAVPGGLPLWGQAAMRQAASATFIDWWWPAQFATSAPAAVRTAFFSALDEMLAPLDSQQGIVHRDYFAGNLFWLPARSGVRRVGIIDFQDAALGHPAYDLVSLVEDARRALPDGLAAHALDTYLALRGECDGPAFRTAYEACAAQRHLRVAALWVRLARRDHKPDYLRFGPHTFALLEAALRRPGAAPLARFMDRFVPPEHRGNPPDAAVAA